MAGPSPGRGVPRSVAQRLHAARLLIFDFDGTLVDSNAIKLRAFDRCFGDFPDRLSEIRTYCWGSHHTPRWEKFQTVYERILNLPFTSGIEKRLHAIYEAETTEAVIAAPEIPGAGAFLRMAHRRFGTALLSSTPDGVLKRILKRREWSRFFNTVRGAPVKKTDWIADSMKRRRLKRREVVFLGDTLEDAASARLAECGFIAVANPSLETGRQPFIENFLPFADRANL